MRFLLDENVPRSLATGLSALGHDVLAVDGPLRSAADTLLLAIATREERVLVTLDKDFGDLIYRRLQPPPPGLVLLRLQPVEIVDRLAVILRAIEVATADTGNYVVITTSDVRVRPLPGAP